MHIRLNTSVGPVQSGIRRYPVNETETISKGIREMLNGGYLKPVNEPTPCCSPMIVVEMYKKINNPILIFIDPSDH